MDIKSLVVGGEDFFSLMVSKSELVDLVRCMIDVEADVPDTAADLEDLLNEAYGEDTW